MVIDSRHRPRLACDSLGELRPDDGGHTDDQRGHVTTFDERERSLVTETRGRIGPPERWQQVDKAFGQWEMPVYSLIQYVIDNEVHHRGQGYVYLRALGIEPPPFYEREF